MKFVLVAALGVIVICGVGAISIEQGASSDVDELICSICKDVDVFLKKQVTEETRKSVVSYLKDQCKLVEKAFANACNEIVKMEDADIEALIKSKPAAFCKTISLC
ncbi:uncharacterized protein LOC129565735 [Sitodiplosis mosellana]|uniref:uncharacterized protein LOC129565735 n=1 Tax=Sitodiplosis mosellana TaxID=263140 RepID=UPI0024443BC6|nr:uncharacterized protein LOC129565735 [Sitodiplosis mosellana]